MLVNPFRRKPVIPEIKKYEISPERQREMEKLDKEFENEMNRKKVGSIMVSTALLDPSQQAYLSEISKDAQELENEIADLWMSLASASIVNSTAAKKSDSEAPKYKVRYNSVTNGTFEQACAEYEAMKKTRDDMKREIEDYKLRILSSAPVTSSNYYLVKKASEEPVSGDITIASQEQENANKPLMAENDFYFGKPAEVSQEEVEEPVVIEYEVQAEDGIQNTDKVEDELTGIEEEVANFLEYDNAANTFIEKGNAKQHEYTRDELSKIFDVMTGKADDEICRLKEIQNVKNEAFERLRNEHKVEDAIRRNNEAIEEQLHPSGKSAKESAKVFIEKFEREENEAKAKAEKTTISSSFKIILNEFRKIALSIIDSIKTFLNKITSAFNSNSSDTDKVNLNI